MNVLRDIAVLQLRRRNVEVLDQQLKQTRDRLQAGEVTRTDVAQAEASLAQSKSDMFAAEAALKMSAASYRQVIGVEPKKLEPAKSMERELPRLVEQAVDIALVQHPSIVSALRQIDAAEHGVRVAEAALSPTLSVNAQVSPQYNSFLGYPGTRQFSAQATASLNVPLYQGGSEYASVRQAKELLGQARLQADLARVNVRANVVAALAQLDAAKASIVSYEAAARAAALSLSGVREEAKVGQRTTLDILNAQQALLAARVNLVLAQHDRVIASYAALGALGRLTARDLKLDVVPYDPDLHYNAVKDKWFGLEPPSGF